MSVIKSVSLALVAALLPAGTALAQELSPWQVRGRLI